MRFAFPISIIAVALGGCSMQISSCSAPGGGPVTLASSTPACSDVKQKDGSIIRTCDDGARVSVMKIGANTTTTKAPVHVSRAPGTALPKTAMLAEMADE